MERAAERPEIETGTERRALTEEILGLRGDIATLRNRIERKDREISHLRMSLGEEKRRTRTVEASWAMEKMRAEGAERKNVRYGRTKVACAALVVALTIQFIALFYLWAVRW